MIGPRRKENEAPRKLHKEKILNLCHSCNIVRIVKSRGLKWRQIKDRRNVLRIVAASMGNIQLGGSRNRLDILGNMCCQFDRS